MTDEAKSQILGGRALTTTLISGPTGSGKTSLLSTFARYLWRKHRKVTRLYISDGGGGVSRLTAMAQRGVIQTYRMRSRVSISSGSRELTFETCHRAAQGWWPAEVNPVDGIGAPSVELVPPVTQTLRMTCPQGHTLVEAQVEARLTPRRCKECEAKNPPKPGMPTTSYGKKTPGVKVTSTVMVTPGFEQVGNVMYDGLTSINDWAMTDLADRTARRELEGEAAAIGGIVKSGDLDFTGNNRAHYQLAQSVAERWLLTSGAIPNLIYPAIWTALETTGKTEDGEGREWGPAIAGSAKTGKVPSWVGNYLGCQKVEGKKGLEFRLYLRGYQSEDGLIHPYKHRAEPEHMPEYLSDWNHDEIKEYLPEWEFDGEPGTPFSGFNLAIFYALLEKSSEKLQQRMAEEFADAPGVPEGGIIRVGTGVHYESDDQTRLQKEQETGEGEAAGGATAAKPAAPLGGGNKPPSKGTVVRPPVSRPHGAAGAPVAAPPGPKPSLGGPAPQPGKHVQGQGAPGVPGRPPIQIPPPGMKKPQGAPPPGAPPKKA